MKLGKFRFICFVLHFWKYHFVKVEYHGFKVGHIATFFCPKCGLYRDLRA